MHNASEKNRALESIAALEASIYFDGESDPATPIIFTPNYVEWEANRVRLNAQWSISIG